MAAKYDRIADDLRHQIQEGELTPGEQLRPETTLLAEYRVSLNTLRRALDILEAEGLIEKMQGIGTFVRTPRQRIQRSTERYQWEKDRVRLPEDERRKDGATQRDAGWAVEDTEGAAEYSVVAAEEELARIFDVPAGTRLLRRVHRTNRRGDPTLFAVGLGSYLVYDMIDGNPDLLDASKEPWPGGTQHQLHTVGIELDRIVDHVTSRPPTPIEARALDLAPGTSVLIVRKISIDTKGRVVEVSDTAWPGDRTELTYTTELERWKS